MPDCQGSVLKPCDMPTQTELLVRIGSRPPGSEVEIPDPRYTPVLPVWPDAGRLLGLGRTAAYNAVRRGDIPTIPLAGRRFVPTVRLWELLLGRPYDPRDPEALIPPPSAPDARRKQPSAA